MKKSIAQILLDEGYIKNFQLIDDGTQGVIRITLKYGAGKEKVISGLRRVSKPGLRVYAGADELPKVLRHVQGRHDRQEGPSGPCRRRSPGICLVRRVIGMSRIGRAPIAVPAGVEVKIEAENVVTVKGPKGTLTRQFHPNMKIEQEGEVIHVTRPNDAKENRALHGLTRTLIHNMVVGVTEGYKKELDVNGVGYRVAKEGNKLVMNLGFSHQVTMEEIPGITIEVPGPNKIIIHGCDKQQVGQFAAEVREKRPPEPYKGKGIKYTDEVIRRKAGKTGAKK